MLRGLLVWIEWDDVHAMANGRQDGQRRSLTVGIRCNALQGPAPAQGQERHHPAYEEPDAKSTDTSDDSGRCVILHEMTHAVHDQFLGNDNPMIEAAYKQAMERKLYDPSMYAATNEHEFFAELTCAYFDQNGYYPRTRADLQKHDPWTYQSPRHAKTPGRTHVASATVSPVATSATLQIKLDEMKLGKPIMGPTMTIQDPAAGRPSIIVLLEREAAPRAWPPFRG